MTILAIYDTETTGLDPSIGDICQFASVVHSTEWPREQTLSFSTLCKPGEYTISKDSEDVHHISQDMVANAPLASTVVYQWLLELIELSSTTGQTLIIGGHNTGFDARFIEKHVSIPEGVGQLCTMRISRRVAPQAKSHKLEYLYREHSGLSSERTGRAHDALADVWMCVELLWHWQTNYLLNPDYAELARWLTVPTLLEIMPFGKHKDTPFSNLPGQYLNYLVSTPGMDEDVKHSARYWLGVR